MLDFQQQFIDLSVDAKALRFGNFELKSGRRSPYFFNAGQFCRGKHLAQLGECYAAKIVESGIQYDLLFGPAYKGIPLVAVTAAALSIHHGIDVPYAFNRKEVKQHGEGGNIVGAELEGRVLIVDDVITAGTAIREVLETIGSHSNCEAVGVVIGLDRKEKGLTSKSAAEDLHSEYSLAVQSIISIDHLIEYLSGSSALQGIEPADHDRHQILGALQDYRQIYGST